MRIVIDLQGAQSESRFRGIGRYALNFVRAVVSERGKHEVLIALNGSLSESIRPIRDSLGDILSPDRFRVWYGPVAVKGCVDGNEESRYIAECVRESFLASLKPDIVHVCSLFEGYVDDAVVSVGKFDRATTTTVSLYDLIPLQNPEHYLNPNPSYARYYYDKVESLRRADALLAISSHAYQEGMNTLGMRAEVFSNVSTGLDERLTSAIDAGTSVTLPPSINRPFVLYSGGVDERKNLPRLISAFRALPDDVRRRHQLVMAGKMTEQAETELRALAAAVGLSADDLVLTGYVDDDTLVGLYKLCQVFAFPSWHEGFGLPPLEAMACGAPVIASNVTSLPEVVGLDEALFDPWSEQAITNKLLLALTDQSFITKSRDHGPRQAALFNWRDVARRAWSVWSGLNEERKGAPVKSDSRPMLAYVSPLPPLRTGIADYSAMLLSDLAAHYEVEVICDDEHCKAVNTQGLPLRSARWFMEHGNRYQRVVYQFGNSPFHDYMIELMQQYPGVLMLHDFYLSSLMEWRESTGREPWGWLRSLYQSHGYVAVRDYMQDKAAAKARYPANLEIINSSLGVLFHSRYASQLLSDWYPGLDQVSALIPLARRSPVEENKSEARARLGLGDDELIFCSFGFVDGTKLNHRIIDALQLAGFTADQRCRLIFVGDNHAGEYGRELLAQIHGLGMSDSVTITGFVDERTFADYLAAADIAVQLRTMSRGETSAAVLDCMAHGLPVVVNANGSMAELPADSVVLLPDEFTDRELAAAFVQLMGDPEKRSHIGASARKYIENHHAPAVCAGLYQKAIEAAYANAAGNVATVVSSLADVLSGFDESGLKQLAGALAISYPARTGVPRLLLDISGTHKSGLHTGIERVVRTLVSELLLLCGTRVRIEPVYLASIDGKWQYRLASGFMLDSFGCREGGLQDELVDFLHDDVLVVMDLAGGCTIEAQQQGLYDFIRDLGVHTRALVYDLLPVRLPHVFPPGADELHERWLWSVSGLDGAICISRATADDLADWRQAQGLDLSGYQIDWFHLGSDFSDVAGAGVADSGIEGSAGFGDRPTFLMVGTIEPRKGYPEALDAFSQLWERGVDVNLVIVGREGWRGLPDSSRRNIPETVERLRAHAELGRRLFWLDDASDERLCQAYRDSDCLIAASLGEGFGLPLIEASRFEIPVIARDIPVFHEVAGGASYYSGAAEGLALAIEEWLQQREGNRERLTVSHQPWKQSAEKFLRTVFAIRGELPPGLLNTQTELS